jgi:MFS family permease
MSSAFKSFGFFNYRLWFAGVTVSNIGTWMQRTAQDWIVLTMLTKNDASAVGVTMALQFGPQLLLVPITGLVVDRMDRRRLLIITQVAMAILSIGLGLLTITGTVQLWMVYVFALLLGIVTAFDGPARQTIVSELVPPAQISNAVGLNATSFNTARLIGPAVAGLLVAAIGSGWVFLLNGTTFAATLIALMLMRSKELTPRDRPPKGRGQIREGFAYVRRRSDLQMLFAMVFVMGLAGLNFPLFMSTMAAVVFGQGAEAFGILSSIVAIGSVAGALVAARRERPRLRNVVLASVGFGASMIAAALMPTLWAFALVLPLIGISSITMLNNANAYVQTTTDPNMRGRVMALYMAVLMGGTPVGAPLIGWIANSYGPRWGMIAGAFGGIVAAAIAAAWWLRRRATKRAVSADVLHPAEGVLHPAGGMLHPAEGARERDLEIEELAVEEAESQRG